MTGFVTATMRFVRGEDGATMVEYGLIAALIALLCIVAGALLGTNLKALFNFDYRQLRMGGSV
jgi:pilus assembly protein Flp/PilA